MAARPTRMVDPVLLLGLPAAALAILAVAFAPATLWLAGGVGLALGAAVSVAEIRRRDGSGLGLRPMRPTASE